MAHPRQLCSTKVESSSCRSQKSHTNTLASTYTHLRRTHQRTNGHSEITNKAIRKLVNYFTQYSKDNWKSWLPTAKILYNNNNHVSSGVALFKVNYRYNPTYDRIPFPGKLIATFEVKLKRIPEFHAKIAKCLWVARGSMNGKSGKGITNTPQRNVVR